MRRQAQHATRRGLTLLEVILATALTVVFLYAVYLATQMHYVQLEVGRELAEEGSLRRGLAELLRADLRGVRTQLFDAASETATSEDGTGDTTSASSDTMASEPSDLPPAGVYGTAAELEIVTWSVSPLLEREGVLPPTGAPGGDVRLVRYYLGTESNPGPNGEVGLIRAVAYPPPPIDGGLDLPEEDTVTQEVAPEVTGLTIAYFDGSDWLDTWETTDSGPLALDLLLEVEGFANPLRVVVALPPSFSREGSASSIATESEADAAALGGAL